METAKVPQVAISTWNIDPAHTVAEFKLKHMMITNVKGHFSGVSGALSLDEHDVTNSKIDVTIPTVRISTRETERDTHLKSADFFDVETFPTITFKSTKVVQQPDDQLEAKGECAIHGFNSASGVQRRDGDLEVEGDLTIRGITRKVRLAVEGPTHAVKDPWGRTRIGASAIAKINRKDYGLAWNAALETGGLMVGDEVTITIDAEFIKA